MLAKQYIAILLVMIFSGKLITVDSDVFRIIMYTNEIVLLNPFCEKKNNDFNEKGNNLKTVSPIHILKLARTCSNNYQLIEAHEIPEIVNSDYRLFIYRNHLVVNIHPKKIYPPPKYSIIS